MIGRHEGLRSLLATSQEPAPFSQAQCTPLRPPIHTHTPHPAPTPAPPAPFPTYVPSLPPPPPPPPSPDLLGALVRGDPDGHAGAELPAKQVHHLRALASSKGSAVDAAVMAPWLDQPPPGRWALVLRHAPSLQALLGPGSAPLRWHRPASLTACAGGGSKPFTHMKTAQGRLFSAPRQLKWWCGAPTAFCT